MVCCARLPEHHEVAPPFLERTSDRLPVSSHHRALGSEERRSSRPKGFFDRTSGSGSTLCPWLLVDKTLDERTDRLSAQR